MKRKQKKWISIFDVLKQHLERKLLRVSSSVLAAALVGLLAPASSHARDVVLFQPGQSSWEWLLVPATHDGGKQMREGKTCLYCHDGEEKTIGNLIASGKKLEPAPISGMPGFVEMTVDASYDDQNVYLSLSWTAPPEANWGDEESATHLTISLGTPDLSVAPIAGCWASCHSDLPGMPDDSGANLTKYLPGSRNKMARTGGGSDIKPAAALDEQLAQGQYLEYWQAVLDGGGLKAAHDGYFLQGREQNSDSAVTATATADGQQWTVNMVRPLAPEGNTRHTLAEGVVYTLTIALHENHSSGRHHYTAFPMRFVLGAGEAELNATRQ